MKKTVAKVLVKNKSGFYLLLYRSNTHPNFPGHPDLPGGEVERDETVKEAVARELLEEVGMTISPDKLEEAFAKEHADVVHVLFLLPIDNNAPVQLSWEHKSYKWLTLDEITSTAIPECTDPYYLDFIQYLNTSSRSLF